MFCRTVDEAGLDDYASNKLDWTIAGDRSVMLNRYSDASNNYYYISSMLDDITLLPYH